MPTTALKPVLPPLLLASKSPRRHQLLRDAGIPFRVVVKELTESYPDELQGAAIAAYLSQLKAQPLESYHTEHLIVSADTIVWQQDQVLGKPADRHDAIRILSALSGNRHEVITGVSLWYQNWQYTFTESTSVWFRPLRQDQISWYVDHFEVMDKAGAYGVQDWVGLTAVERIEGDFYNVMGLPVCRLVQVLEQHFEIPFTTP